MGVRSDEKRLRKHGLNIDDMTDDDIRSANAADIYDMDMSTLGTGLYSFGQMLSGDSDTAMIMGLLKAQIRQQWIIVRQNEQIIRLLREANGKEPCTPKTAPRVPIVSVDAIIVNRDIARVGTRLALEGSNLVNDSGIGLMLGVRQLDTIRLALDSGGSEISVSAVQGGSATVSVYASGDQD